MKSKSIQQSDYEDIAEGVAIINYAIADSLGEGIDIYIPHHNRFWEYGSAMTAYLAKFGQQPTQVIDIGCGKSPLGPALALETGATVTEIDPDERLVGQRGEQTDRRSFHVGDLTTIPTDTKYDAVFCMSVIEHIPMEGQDAAWSNLAELVKPGGLLFVTTDFGPSHELIWHWDTERVFKFDPGRVYVVAKQLEAMGFTLDLDPTFYGAEVYDYTFFRWVAHAKT